MFDLRSSFEIKVTGRDRLEATDRDEKTMFLCVTSHCLYRLLEAYPKSKMVIQKRALERRKVFVDKLENVEKILEKRFKANRRAQKQRLKL